MDSNDTHKNKFVERKKDSAMRCINSKKIFTAVLLLCLTIVANAQDGTKQVDFMRSNGRIYVVIAVMLTILAGIILYLVRLEKKLKKLEKDQ
jgi:uncharacterized integral membrane protein